MLRTARFLPAAAVAAAAALALSACGESAAADSAAEGSGDSDTLVFASIPEEESSSLEQNWAKVIEVIEEETGKAVEVQSATDYAAVIEAQRAGKVDIAAYGPFSYVTAADSGIEMDILGAGVEEAGGEPGYQSYGIVPADSDISDLAGFKGKKVCFVDPTSTSGYLYPSAGLIENDIDPENDVEATFAGGHDASALSVADGTCDAGFAYDSMVDSKLIESGQLEEGALKTVWKSETIAGSPVVASHTLDEDLRTQLKEIFESELTVDALVESGHCDSAEDCELPEGNWGYKPVEDSFYDGVRKVCEVTESESCVS